MRETWQYLVMVWEYTTKMVDQEQTWAGKYYIYRTGVETVEKEPTGSFVGLLDELGADGWELVTSEPTRNTLVSTFGGWTEVSMPVRIRWTFKRRVEQA